MQFRNEIYCRKIDQSIIYRLHSMVRKSNHTISRAIDLVLSAARTD